MIFIEDLFKEENYYWCMNCGKYSSDLIAIDEREDKEIRTYCCVLCGEYDFETIYLD